MIDQETQPAADHLVPRSRPGRPVRVCFLIDNLSRAGTETQLLALLRAFDRKRVEPFLVLLDGEGEQSQSLEPDHCPVLRLGVQSFASRRALRAARTFARFLRNSRIDILQCYFLDSLYFGVPVARWARLRRIVRVRNNLGYWLTRKHRLLHRLYAPWIDRTLTNSEQGRAALVAQGVAPRQIVVLENGVDVERFIDCPPRFDREVRIGAVANLRPVKRLDLLIRAAANLLKRCPTLHFEVAGEGPQRAELEGLIQELGIVERFRLVGPVADVPSFLASLDIAVLCSESEGMSNALLEYMAAARVIVATRVGAAEKLIRDGVDGLLIPRSDERALADAIDRLLRDPYQARQLGASARQRAIVTFSRDAMRRRFEQFYLSLILEHQK